MLAWEPQGEASSGMTRLTAALLLVTAMCFTGTNVPLGKALISEIPVYGLVLFRFAIATAVLAVLARNEDGPRLSQMSLVQMRDLLALSLLGSIAYMTLSLEGVKRTSGVDAGIILATLPAVAAGLGMVIKRERPGAIQAIAIALAVGGLLVVNTAAATGGHPGSTLGNLLVGAAVLCEAIFVLVSSRISAVFRPIRLALGVSATSLVLAVPLGVSELLALPWGSIGAATWAAAVWYALSASVFCSILWYRGAPHVETWLAGLSTAALPISALVLSAVMFGEQLDGARTAGAALVIGAIVLGAMAPARPTGRSDG
jgi:drug/metabolite transporter (DMT)-like permease